MTGDDAFLRHILDAISEIEEFTADGKTAFDASRLIQRGVERNLEIIGEAAKRLSEPVRSSHPDVPWRAMAGLRDILSHAYHRVDSDLVWQTVAEAVPKLRTAVEAILSSPPEG